MDHLQTTAVLGSVAGLTSHAVFKRQEPTIQKFLSTVALVGFVSYATSSSLSGVPLTHPTLANVLAASVAVASFVGALALSIAHYRLLSKSHPLYGIPGPIPARLSQLWLFRSVLDGQVRLDMKKIHEVYGDVVRIGPNEVSVATADAILQVYGAHSWIKGSSYSQTASGTSLISIRDHAVHGQRRKLWDRAFALQNLKDYTKVIGVRVEALDKQLSKRAKTGEVFDLHAFFGYFVWDTMSDLAYGGGGKMLEACEDVDRGLEKLCAGMNLAGINKTMPWVSPITQRLPAWKGMTAFRDIAMKLFKSRRERGQESAEHDIFYHLLGEGTDDGAKLTTQELAADSALVIAAGADTTRLVLTELFMLLGRHPERYRELQKVLDAILPTDDVPTYESVAAIPLVDAFIQESLRLNPPLSFANQRESPAGGQMIGKYHIGEGQQVRFAVYSIHRDPRYFSHPNEFRPERWLPEGQNRGATVKDKRAFMAFSTGPYHCVGKQFAFQEMRLVLSAIVRKYDLEFAEGFDSYAFESSYEERAIIEIHESLRVRLKLRK